MNVNVGIGVWIVKEDKFLLGKRKGSHGDEKRGPPGGHFEFGESFEGCAARETEEETGLSITNIQELGVTNDFFEEDNKHYVTIHLLAEYAGGRLQRKEPEKCQEWKRFYLHDFPKKLFLPIQNLLIKSPKAFNQYTI